MEDSSILIPKIDVGSEAVEVEKPSEKPSVEEQVKKIKEIETTKKKWLKVAM